MEHALASLGDPTQLAAQFVAEARTRFGIRSYAPWTLLRRTARFARTGVRGVFIFLIGLFGYAATLGWPNSHRHETICATCRPMGRQLGNGVGSSSVWRTRAGTAWTLLRAGDNSCRSFLRVGRPSYCGG